jgi:hypothetical protein
MLRGMPIQCVPSDPFAIRQMGVQQPINVSPLMNLPRRTPVTTGSGLV